MIEVPDSIERHTTIQADIKRVYELVARPGWWINQKHVGESEVSTVGDVSTVTHPKHGTFKIKTVSTRPPHFVSFKWLAGLQDDGADAPGTLVEFWLEETTGGVKLKVLESGFSTLPGSAEERRKRFEGNSEGWEFELDVARRHFEEA